MTGRYPELSRIRPPTTGQPPWGEWHGRASSCVDASCACHAIHRRTTSARENVIIVPPHTRSLVSAQTGAQSRETLRHSAASTRALRAPVSDELGDVHRPVGAPRALRCARLYHTDHAGENFRHVTEEEERPVTRHCRHRRGPLHHRFRSPDACSWPTKQPSRPIRSPHAIIVGTSDPHEGPSGISLDHPREGGGEAHVGCGDGAAG